MANDQKLNDANRLSPAKYQAIIDEKAEALRTEMKRLYQDVRNHDVPANQARELMVDSVRQLYNGAWNDLHIAEATVKVKEPKRY